MSKLSRIVWLSLLLVFGACNVVQMVLMALDPDLFGEREESDLSPGELPVEVGDKERAEAASKKCKNLERLLKERLSVLESQGNSNPVSGQAIEAAARERISEKQDETRERYTDVLTLTLGEHIGRKLEAKEQELVEQANRSYFNAIDEVREKETVEEKRRRLADAARERVEALAGIVGSSSEASRLVASAMYSLQKRR